MNHFSINYNELKTDWRASLQSIKDNINSLGKNDHHLVQIIELSIAEKKSRYRRRWIIRRGRTLGPKESQNRDRNSKKRQL